MTESKFGRAVRRTSSPGSGRWTGWIAKIHGRSWHDLCAEFLSGRSEAGRLAMWSQQVRDAVEVS